MSETPWGDRAVEMTYPHFTKEDLEAIASDAALDLISSGMLRTLVIMFASNWKVEEVQ